MIFSLFVFPASATSSWSKPRPSIPTTYNEKTEHADTDGHASVGIGVHICEYTEGVAGYDYLHLIKNYLPETSIQVCGGTSLKFSYLKL